MFFFKINRSLKPNLNSKLVISHFWTSSYGGSYKITIFLCVFLYVCLSVCLSVSLPVRLSVRHFFQEWIIIFFWYFEKYIGKHKNLLFSGKINFCPNLGKQFPSDSKIGFFWEILSLFFPGNNIKWKSILLLIFHLELWAKMLSANQILKIL